MIPPDIQAMLDVYTDGTPAVPTICACGGVIELDDYETERYICVSCLKTYGNKNEETENE